MKRKHFTKPPKCTTFGNWLFAELFIRNITINELAISMGVKRPAIIYYMQHTDFMQTHRILQICAILSNTIYEYHKMVNNATRALPQYNTIYNTINNTEKGQPCQK